MILFNTSKPCHHHLDRSTPHYANATSNSPNSRRCKSSFFIITSNFTETFNLQFNTNFIHYPRSFKIQNDIQKRIYLIRRTKTLEDQCHANVQRTCEKQQQSLNLKTLGSTMNPQQTNPGQPHEFFSVILSYSKSYSLLLNKLTCPLLLILLALFQVFLYLLSLIHLTLIRSLFLPVLHPYV